MVLSTPTQKGTTVSKKDSKKKSVDKATESSKKAQKAVKEGKAKRVEEAPVEAVRVSEFAVDGEKPEWNAELDAQREIDFSVHGMTEKAARILRNQRVRQLKKGVPMDSDASGQLELAVQTTTDAPPLPEGMAPLDAIVADAEPVESMIQSGKLSKKERKAEEKRLAAEQQAAAERAEADRIAAEKAAEPAPELSKKEAKKAAKQLAKEQAAAAAFVPKAAPVEEPTKANVVAAGGTPARTAGSRAPRLDPIHDALTQAQREANETGKVVEREAPREYVNKNYGLRLAEKYAPQFPGLTTLDDKFNPDTQKFIVTFVVKPAKG